MRGDLPPRIDARNPNSIDRLGDMRYTRISADSHIDMPWIPNDLFTRNATAALKDRMPYVADGPDGPYWTCRNGMSFGLVCGTWSTRSRATTPAASTA